MTGLEAPLLSQRANLPIELNRSVLNRNLLSRISLGQNLLWLDCAGAGATALVTGLILTTWLSTGLPSYILYAFSLTAVLYTSFDLYALRFWPTARWPLATIGCLNLAYCMATAIVCLFFHESLTYLGTAYFFLEACIVVPLAFVEIWLSRKSPDSLDNPNRFTSDSESKK